MDLKEFLREKKWKKMKKDQWLILFLAGVLLLVVAMPTGKSSSKTVKQQNAQTEIAQTNGTGSGESDYEKTLETRLAQILEGMEGVGNVQVMITSGSGRVCGGKGCDNAAGCWHGEFRAEFFWWNNGKRRNIRGGKFRQSGK